MEMIEVRTRSRSESVEITRDVQDAVSRSGLMEGVAVVYSSHTTGGITVNEHADPSVVQDTAAQLEATVPRSGKYLHREGNADAHIKTSLMGASESIPVENGGPVLGTWQGVFFCEFDGPRSRTVYISVVGA